jgi:class 3 adenylate cyclase/predicted ATPase
MDVEAWLRNLDLEQYAPNFRDHAVDGTCLARLTSDDLKDLGVSLVGHRRKLLNAIADLRRESLAASAEAERAIGKRDAAPSDAERRQLTVVCCDLVESTELTAHLDPEDMGELIRGVLTAVSASVARFGGYVAKFTGDGALIYFGYPQAHEDDAERAVRAGLDIVEAIRGIGRERGTELNVRVGIATSPVVVGELVGQGTAQERSVVGEAPNLASRLQRVAKPNMVVVAPETRKLLGGLFELQIMAPQTLKGFAEPVPAWLVLGESPYVNRFEAARAESIVPLIGREHEVSLLVDRWRLACGGHGQVVLLSGEAGIGKSRLAQALRGEIRGQHHVAVRYQCSPHHANQPFYPAIGQIWHAAGFSPGESTQARLDKLEGMVAQSQLDRAKITPCLAALLSIPTAGRYAPFDLPPSLMKERTIDALIALLVGLTRSAPVLFLLEDAHWIDPTTLELTNRAFQEWQNLPVLSLITFRPEFTPTWDGRAQVTSLSLNRLERREARALVEAVAGGKALPADVLEQIIIKADGVPLFIEELTKTVLESGSVHQQLTQPSIPATLHDSLMARLDRLGPVKEIAQIGAAIGREFSYPLIEAVAPVASAALQDALQELVDSELISVRGGRPDPIYVFKHALVQDTAYASLLRSRRRRIHANIARALVERSDLIQSAPEVIAHHYTEAGLAAPAVRYWLKAAELALSRSANTEGTRYAETGLTLIEWLTDAAERQQLELALQVARGNAALALKGHTAPETVEILSLVKTFLDSGIGNDMQRFSVLYGLWAANYGAARIANASDLARQYLEVANRQSDTTYLMIGQRIVGAGLIAAGRHREGLVSLEAAEQHYDPVRHRPLSYRFGQDIGLAVLCHKVWALWFLGRSDQAARLSGEILAELPRHGHAATVAFCTLYGGVCPSIFAGEFERAARLGAELTAYCLEQKMGPHYAVAGRLSSRVGDGLQEPGCADIQAIQNDMEELHRLGVYVLDSPIHAALAQILIAMGDVECAETVLNEGISFAEESGERYWLAELHRLKGQLALQQLVPDTVGAATCFTQAIEIAQDQEACPLALRAATDLVRLWHEAGSAGDAAARLVALIETMEGDVTSLDVKRARDLLARIELTVRRSA